MSSGDTRFCCIKSVNSAFQCYIDTADHPMCMEEGQFYVCGYRDAIVCRNKDHRGFCLYSNSSLMDIQPLCVCKENEFWPTTPNQQSQIGRSCMDNATTTGLPGSSPGPPTATTSSVSDRTTKISPMGDQTTATLPMGDQTTAYNSPISDHQTAPTSSTRDQPSGTTFPRKSDSGGTNTIAIVLGAILVIVLLVLLVVCLVRRRRNKSTPKKVTTNATNSSDVSLAERAQIPDPLGGTEYNYAYDHRPEGNPAFDPGTSKPVNRYEENEPSGSSSTTARNSSETHEVPKYYELGQSNDGRAGEETPKYYELGQASNDVTGGKLTQAPKYYELGQVSNAVTRGKTTQVPKYDGVRRTPHSEQRNAEKTPKGHNFELAPLGYDPVGVKTPQAHRYDEVQKRPPKEQSSYEQTPQDHNYFKLERSQDNDNETVLDEAANPPPVGFPNQGNDHSYMPLQLNAVSGYEPLKLPALAARRNDSSSPYDHLNNKTGIRSQKVEPPESEDGDQYASLNI
ncbi:uncharacterized protein LOC117290419 isoform X2 [Asterias rubens]|uniref:uncharacterized protein LOC117290419 isoform X2 n=1 Tax=Asterias rubens TaxID=7604 RepID=UPI00145563C0|nr:uncharacterized protein LOC117290419 isoform X2 [Asterias rubens]